MLKCIVLAAALTLVACATARSAAKAPGPNCAARCAKLYGQPMPAAKALPDGQCSCLPDVVNLSVVMHPVGWIATQPQPAAKEK
jgi:hypothetical protein